MLRQCDLLNILLPRSTRYSTLLQKYEVKRFYRASLSLSLSLSLSSYKNDSFRIGKFLVRAFTKLEKHPRRRDIRRFCREQNKLQVKNK